MISNLEGAGVSVPGGFATTAQAYRDFLELSGLNAQIHATLDALDVDDVNALAKAGSASDSSQAATAARPSQRDRFSEGSTSEAGARSRSAGARSTVESIRSEAASALERLWRSLVIPTVLPSR